MKREGISTMVRPRRGEVWLVQLPFSDLTKNQASLASQPACQAERGGQGESVAGRWKLRK